MLQAHDGILGAIRVKPLAGERVLADLTACDVVIAGGRANAEVSGMKDALQSQTVYLCDMSDASLFLVRYEKLDFASAAPASASVGRVCARCVPIARSGTVSDGRSRVLV